jgi:hypothetical protein
VSSTHSLTSELERAHRQGVSAAAAGMSDPALGTTRLAGPGVTVLADAAVSSATPFVRAPLLRRLSAVRRLHPVAGDAAGQCPACAMPAPCDTARETA